MKSGQKRWNLGLLLVMLLAGFLPASVRPNIGAAVRQISQATDPPTQTSTETATPTETATATPTVPPSTQRPQLIVKHAGPAGGESVTFGQDFDLNVTLKNSGHSPASQIEVIFTPGDLIPRNNGGVLAAGGLGAGDDKTVHQPMTVDDALWGKQFASVVMTVNYSDSAGTGYTGTFNISVPLVAPSTSSGSTSVTPTVIARPQMVITSYGTSVPILEPGVQFTLDLGIDNTGTGTARQILMIAGGGSASPGGNETPQPGGISGGSGQFTTFAPVQGSNVQSLGDLAPGATLTAKQELIVNVAVTPGAYPFPISFSYVDDKGNPYTDDQVITLLVYNLPKLDISFYRDPNPITSGQPNQLPLQVVNLGKSTTVLGNMRVTSSSGSIENGQALVGSLEPGGYFTLDSTLIPENAGAVDIIVSVDYTDDFNEPRVVTQKLSVEVQEGFVEPVSPDGGGKDGQAPPVNEETLWQKVKRFVLGILGLDSSPPETQNPGAIPTESPSQPIPVGPGPKG